jgi:hypothetical protein
VAYSLFDKIAYFLNDYLELKIPERAISFRSVWYEGQRKKDGLRQDFVACENLPLRGLFWLSKDLYENKQGFREAIEPVARELAEIRNHLEHKYLKLHSEWAGVPSPDARAELPFLTDSLAHSLCRDDFEDKTMHLLKMARAALIYLSLAVHSEENRRQRARDPQGLIMPMPLDRWEDDWKC